MSDLDNATKKALELIMFEQWLRFSFIAAARVPSANAHGSEVPVLVIPKPLLMMLRHEHPHLEPLVNRLNGHPIDPENACTAIVDTLAEEVDKNTRERIFDDPTFQQRVALFQLWVHNTAEALEADPRDFTTWQELFAAYEHNSTR